MTIKSKTIGELVSELAGELLMVKRRLFFLEAIISEFDTYDQGKTGQVIVRNFVVYDLVRDSYEMLIIDLASICKHFLESGGVFVKLSARLNEIRPISRNKLKVREPNILEEPGHVITPKIKMLLRESHEKYEKERLANGVKESITRLFPNWNGQKVSQTDLAELKDRFAKIVEKLKDDRNTHRAHKFEAQSRSNRQSVAPVTLDDIKECFKAVEEILVELSLICDLANRDFDRDMNQNSSMPTAKDIADIILNGSINTLLNNMDLTEISHKSGECFQYYWQFREKVTPKLARTPLDDDNSDPESGYGSKADDPSGL